MTNEEIDQHLRERYEDKRCAVLYSAGFDSSVLAHTIQQMPGSRVALVCTDPGRENSPWSEFYQPDQPEDMVKDVWQFRRYATLLEDHRQAPPSYDIWPTRLPELNALVTQADVLLPPDNPSAERDEAQHGLTFYSGFVLQRLAAALSIAAARGYDYVLTGHMGWNEHYLDESAEFAERLTELFRWAYGSRIRKIPRIEMPYRDLGLTKVQLIQYNAWLAERGLPTSLTISCNVCELVRDEENRVKNFVLYAGLQVHCGRCQHCLDRRASFAEANVQDRSLWAS